MDKAILSELEKEDLSKNTLKAITSDFKSLDTWHRGIYKTPFSLEELTHRDMQYYKDYCQKQGHSVNTISRRLINIRKVCAIAKELGLIDENPAKGIKTPSQQNLSPKGLKPTDLRRLLKEVDTRGSLRDRLAVELMVFAGLRVSELTKLKVENLHIGERKGHAVIRNSKGGKTREVPLSKTIRELAEKHIKDKDPEENVFTGQRGVLTSLAFNKMLEKYTKKADIKCSPHSLRHTFAYNYLEKNQNDIVGLKQILGHSNINTTAIYTQHRLEDLQEKVERLN